ncbi:unnamed protein product [Didymodactylos carnosus]|uniref:RING-type domain-containing protein n=1 Tax=Didymodactylos carnosus TaxID=1234261 RepID=A0A814Q640_9BILA|nr:unnamed protein product [Didymodactylos carnosus]CAF3879736.1 unnamed protein product [Didymodactylos carnosus]
MANSQIVAVRQSISSTEEGGIDRDRIVDGHLVPDEYFCPICRCLLWNPRSCASCQHLFCQKCIRAWLENENSDNKCPFRCEPYEDRRCPPYFHSLLARLNIQCQNCPFGCTRVLPYNSLEQHENFECEYFTQRCSECEQLVLLTKFNEHREISGLCVPRPIKCTICGGYIEKPLFRDHFHGCYQLKFNALFEQTNRLQVLQTSSNDQITLLLNRQALIQTMMDTDNLFEQQRQMSRLPTNLAGVDAVRRAREQGCARRFYASAIQATTTV